MSWFIQNVKPEGIRLPAGLVPLAQIVIPADGSFHVTAHGGVMRDPVAGFFVLGIQQNGAVLDWSCAGFPLRADTNTEANIAADLECKAGDIVNVFVTQVSRNSLVAGTSRISAFMVK
jgi:hypothetical protein